MVTSRMICSQRGSEHPAADRKAECGILAGDPVQCHAGVN